MHPLTTDLAEQILALVRIEAYSLLGAIQDGKTVLGGSGGSGGGTGNPPAGFVGQLTQSNVTFDTEGAARACSAGSAGSSSLVDNLDAIRLGLEICGNAIDEDHIDWGAGAGQVSAVDVPFSSGSLDATNVRDAIEEAYSEGTGVGDHDHTSSGEGGQLDWDGMWLDAIHDHSSAGEGGQKLLSLTDIRCNAAVEETIDSFGNINPDQMYIRVDTLNDGVTDNLDTIVGGTEGDLLIMRPENDARTVVVRHNVGNIWLKGNANISLDDINDHMLLIFNGSMWCDLF